ncbi:MAG TPA: ATP-binding protein [Pyrinomonadaceae bacterium]|jgi:two-component system phosphate regulon sensor histidine kinase PhoR|nr:ATP-binding protein [Pyrinomonadaceae bacterium]
MTRVILALFVGAAVVMLAAGLLLRSQLFFASGLALMLGLAAGMIMRRTTGERSAGAETSETQPLHPQLLDVALNEMREGVVVIDTDMRVVASNRAAETLFTKGDPRQSRLTELTRNPAIYDAFLDAVRGIERDGVRVETYTSGHKIFDLRVVPLRSSDNAAIAGAVGVFFDISRLERLEIVRQEFLANVSHELRTPLTSILASAETLETSINGNCDSEKKFLSIIHKNAARMQRLINDLLELGAIENVRVDVEPIRLFPLVEDIVNSLSVGAAEKKVTLQNLIAKDAEVSADPHRLMQMLTNLIDNAIKFNREGGTVTIDHERSNVDIIRVRDTGEGIPTQHLDRLFERFYRVDRARSRNLGGTGLGLAIVKHLARAHGGDVSVTSRVGEGSEFTIRLPRSTDN